MARSHPTLVQRVASHRDGIRVFVMLVAVVVAMALVTAIFGVNRPGPGYDFMPDPAAGLPF
jgi:hypothetical protein